MDINRFTEKAQEAIRSAQSKAVRYGQQQIDVEHLLASLLAQEGGLAPSILTKAGVAADSLTRRVESELDRLPKVSGPSGGPDHIYVSSRLNRLLTAAEDEARHDERDGEQREVVEIENGEEARDDDFEEEHRRRDARDGHR